MGKPGARKTTFCLQFPEPHVMDCDCNLDGPTDFLLHGITDKITGKVIIPPVLPTLSYSFDSIRLDDKKQVVETYNCFDRLCDKLKLFKSDPEYKKRKTVVVDSLSHVNEFIIRKVMKSKQVESMALNHWTDFATNAYTMIAARLDETDKTVLCTCHLENVFEADTQNIMKKTVKEVNPLFSGRVGDGIGAYFTDVWMLEKRQDPKGIQWFLMTDRVPKCDHLKNSLGMPNEINITPGFSVLAPYLTGRI